MRLAWSLHSKITMKNKFTFLIRLAGVSALSAFACVTGADAQEWGNPVWSDEFDSSVPGTPPDTSKWTFDVGGSGWGNHELEIYCAAGASVSAAPGQCNSENPNAFQDGQGHLVIRASRVNAEPAATGAWTSARLKTMGLKDFQYGRMEACIKLPVGAGLWPAFWMLGTSRNWPAGGEIDIMENVPATGGSSGGLGPTKIESTIHGPSTSQRGLFSLTRVFTLPGGQRIDDANPACHVYGAIWSPFLVQMYVDDWRKPFFIRTAADVPREGRWVFNAPFYFLLNLAVGGDWPGPPDDTTPSTADMVVDYVRVYKAKRVDAPKMTASPVTVEVGKRGTTVHVTSAIGSGYVYPRAQ
jgi:beta-glucanase (GH16 family)